MAAFQKHVSGEPRRSRAEATSLPPGFHQLSKEKEEEIERPGVRWLLEPWLINPSFFIGGRGPSKSGLIPHYQTPTQLYKIRPNSTLKQPNVNPQPSFPGSLHFATQTRSQPSAIENCLSFLFLIKVVRTQAT